MPERLPTLSAFLTRHARDIALLVGLAALGLVMCAWLIPSEWMDVREQLLGFPDSDAAAQMARPKVIAILCMTPLIGGLLYTLGDTLDRYISRRFLGMFGICLTALFLIWFLMNLTDNIGDFQRSGHFLQTLFVYYTTRSPAVLLLLLPYSLLLSLLESIGKLSSSREIIAIIQSGRGVLRLTIPLIVAGVLCTVVSIGLNYHWAPTSEGRQEEILAEANGKVVTDASKVLYRSRETQRLWMVTAFPPDFEKGSPLQGVEVTTTDSDGQLRSRLTASEATWNQETREWIFQHPQLCYFQPGKPPVFENPTKPLVINSWPETPWMIIKPGLPAEYLGIPDLNSWLLVHEQHPQFADPEPYQTHWHYRWALPFTCLITVLLATPFAIHFSRRGAGGGIFLAVVLSAMMLLVNTISISFGEAGLLPPIIAAWLPNTLFASLGIYLYHRRIHGRPIYHTIRRLFAPA